MSEKIHGDLEVVGKTTGIHLPIILVANPVAMQVCIDSGDCVLGQLFRLKSDGTLRRMEIGGGHSIIEKYYNKNSEGYIRFTTIKTSDLTEVRVNSTGATGWCYSVNGGAPAYFAGGNNDKRTIPIPATREGVPHTVDIWPANSTTSGRVGDLTLFWCESNSLTSLDVSGLTALAKLRCVGNSLTSLDVSGLTSLAEIFCGGNSLTSLDVSGLISLTSLSCYSNSLTSLDVSGLTALGDLDCNGNSLTSLDANGSTAMTYFDCANNTLTSLDVSGITALETLFCERNALTSLDVSGLTSLTQLICFDNPALALVDATGMDGASIAHTTTFFSMQFDGCGLSTDAVYTMLNGMLMADPTPSWIILTDNPCDGGSSLIDGTVYTAAQTNALAVSKNYGLAVVPF